MDFVRENFTPQEAQILNRYFTNIDRPVFGLVNLPDVVKGALFARYSRSNKTLRRLFLDEFYKPESDSVISANDAGVKRASALYDKMILDFGDDSVAQLGGAHIACEQVSNILTKILERGRLAAYLEQSTRYVYYNEKINGRYHYVIPTEIKGTPYEALYCSHSDSLFDTYTEILAKITPILKAKFPMGAAQSPRAWESIIRAKACDIVRGLLPASTRSNLGIFANGQFYEYMLIKMYASKNLEVVGYADMILEELRKIIPSFLTRVDLEDRGKQWSKYINMNDAQMSDVAESLFDNRIQEHPCRKNNFVDLVDWDKEAENKTLRSALFEYTHASVGEIQAKINTISDAQRQEILTKYCGDRLNRRHKPGRAFETANYHFEVLSDYGAFRDLQRHRVLTIQWQKLSPVNGFGLPVELDEYPELREIYEKALIKSAEIHNTIKSQFGEDIAQYVIPFAYRLRYEINMNLREAFHFIELRSQKQGHYSYRKISIEMHRLIAEKAGHKLFADMMKFVDPNFYDLAREDAENAKESKTI